MKQEPKKKKGGGGWGHMIINRIIGQDLQEDLFINGSPGQGACGLDFHKKVSF